MSCQTSLSSMTLILCDMVLVLPLAYTPIIRVHYSRHTNNRLHPKLLPERPVKTVKSSMLFIFFSGIIITLLFFNTHTSIR